ncbi:DUF4198 domain-containing protein [Aeoliella mucimassa]|uniref:Carboxypeptidase regulatory-like domain-containing protein n=1 Tax=Aeoliella mucimassa TaxID=2527972 RepID=A0A518API5_9BACT|nr:DUF4198 domain-containing protein [Aeoliella mucimassa]QDU56637.1 hypothetical protein Pan181_28470 [Aeoliella mucimassa]
MAVRIAHFLFAFFLAVQLGCSDEGGRVPVSGRVLIDGQPLQHGRVQVVPEGSRPAYGELNEAGEYTLMTYDDNDGTMPGTHKAMITAVESIDGWHNKWHAPKKYSTFDGGVTVEIRPDGTASDIELSWDGGKPFVEDNRKN